MGATTSRMPNWRSMQTARFWLCARKTIANLGAYLSTFASSVPTYLYGHAPVRPIRYPGDLLRGRRGLHQHRAGRCLSRRRAAGSDLRRRTADGSGGARAGIDPAELRRKNFINTFPHQTPVIMSYDAGDYAASLDEGAGDRRLEGLRQAQARAPRSGKLRGLGFSTYIEACGIAPSQAVGSLGAGVGFGNRRKCASIRPARWKC